MLRFLRRKPKQVKTVGQVLLTFQKTIDELDVIRVHNNEQVTKEEDLINRAKLRQETATEEAKRAGAVAEKIKALIS